MKTIVYENGTGLAACSISEEAKRADENVELFVARMIKDHGITGRTLVMDTHRVPDAPLEAWVVDWQGQSIRVDLSRIPAPKIDPATMPAGLPELLTEMASSLQAAHARIAALEADLAAIRTSVGSTLSKV